MSSRIAQCGPRLLDEWSQDNPFVVLVGTTQGTGKSTGLAERIAYYIGFVAMFAPRHVDIDEDLEETPLGNRFKHHFRGKDRVCENEDYKGNHVHVSNSVSQNWCKNCGQRDTCEYFNAYQEVGSWDPNKVPHTESVKASAPSFMAVHQHLNALPKVFSGSDGNSTWDQVEAVIIDESPYETVAINSLTVALKDIRAELDVLDQIESADPDVNNLVAEAESLLGTTKQVVEDDGDTHTLFEEWVGLYEKYIEHKEVFENALGGKWGEQASREGNPVILSILETIPEVETVIYDAVANDRMVNQEGGVKELWRVSDEDEPKLTISYANLSALRQVAQEKPVFALATEWPREIAEVVFDLPIVEITDDLKPAVDVLQNESDKAGIWALNQGKRLDRNLQELTTLAVNRESLRSHKTLVVAKKAVKDRVRQSLIDYGLVEGEDFELAHYYGLSGSNQYEDCDAIVLHGSPAYSDDIINLNHHMTGIPKDELRFEKCQGELRDALHRIRASQKDGVRAYIWTNRPDFRTELNGSYFEASVPQLREKLETEIESEHQRRKDEQYVLETLEQCDGWITGTEFKSEVGEQYRSTRDRLVEEGRIDYKKESDGGPGRPTKKFRYIGPLPN